MYDSIFSIQSYMQGSKNLAPFLPSGFRPEQEPKISNHCIMKNHCSISLTFPIHKTFSNELFLVHTPWNFRDSELRSWNYIVHTVFLLGGEKKKHPTLKLYLQYFITHQPQQHVSDTLFFISVFYKSLFLCLKQGDTMWYD